MIWYKYLCQRDEYINCIICLCQTFVGDCPSYLEIILSPNPFSMDWYIIFCQNAFGCKTMITITATILLYMLSFFPDPFYICIFNFCFVIHNNMYGFDIYIYKLRSLEILNVNVLNINMCIAQPRRKCILSPRVWLPLVWANRSCRHQSL